MSDQNSSIHPLLQNSPFLRAALTERLVWDHAGARVPLHSNVSTDEACLLYDVIRFLKPEKTLEIGFCQGISALAILQALEDNGRGTHHVVDPFQRDYGNAGLEMVRRAGLEGRLHFVEAFPEEVVPTMPSGFGFAFIDASHLFDLTLLDFMLVQKKLDPGAVVGLHDLWMPSLQKVWRYLTSNRSCVPCDAEFRRTSDLVIRLQRPWRTRLKIAAGRLAGWLPGCGQAFSPEFLTPWETLGVPNLALLRTGGPDQREWTFHHTF
jgi:predicted O-methyltransferase YrrM